MDPLNNIVSSSVLLSGVEIGTHYYWNLGPFSFHGQVFLVSWVVIALLLTISFLATSNVQQIPGSWQNFMESTVEFTQDIAKTKSMLSASQPKIQPVLQPSNVLLNNQQSNI